MTRNKLIGLVITGTLAYQIARLDPFWLWSLPLYFVFGGVMDGFRKHGVRRGWWRE